MSPHLDPNNAPAWTIREAHRIMVVRDLEHRTLELSCGGSSLDELETWVRELRAKAQPGWVVTVDADYGDLIARATSSETDDEWAARREAEDAAVSALLAQTAPRESAAASPEVPTYWVPIAPWCRARGLCPRVFRKAALARRLAVPIELGRLTKRSQWLAPADDLARLDQALKRRAKP